MKMKKLLALLLAATLVVSMVGCGEATDEPAADAVDTDASVEADVDSEANAEDSVSETAGWTYNSITLGTDYTDLTAEIKFLHHKTDRDSTSGGDGAVQAYIAEFNEVYPNITVVTEAVTDYAEDALLRLSTGNWGDVMFIPAVDKSELATYFMSYGTYEDMSSTTNYVSNWMYDGNCYGIPYMAGANGMVYNKAVFAAAGITELPTTPEEFIAALQMISDNTDAIPLYTNYYAQWTMGAWDDYAAASTGDYTFFNQQFVHTAAPFADPGDGTGLYNQYKLLFDAVANGLIEDDYTTTDWEGCKGMINRGEIGCMVLGSWAYQQMVDADVHGEDIGYMPFPITVDGTQYVKAGGDYNYGINANSDDTNKLASTIFVKWMTEQSGWSFNEGGLPIAKSDTNFPALYEAFADCVMMEEDIALAGEEDLLNQMNAETELMFNAGGNQKVMEIIECADTGSKTYDEIMAEWTAKWNDAQTELAIEVLY